MHRRKTQNGAMDTAEPFPTLQPTSWLRAVLANFQKMAAHVDHATMSSALVHKMARHQALVIPKVLLFELSMLVQAAQPVTIARLLNMEDR